MSHKNPAAFGKRQEYAAIAELLRRGFDVYPTLVDVQGIDCVIRLDEERYLDIQIKARSIEAKQWNFFAAMTVNPRDNFYFIFYTEKNDTFWVIPSRDLVDLCVENPSGKNKGKMNLSLPKLDSGEKAGRFEDYKNDSGFRLLKQYNHNAAL